MSLITVTTELASLKTLYQMVHHHEQQDTPWNFQSHRRLVKRLSEILDAVLVVDPEDLDDLVTEETQDVLEEIGVCEELRELVLDTVLDIEGQFRSLRDTHAIVTILPMDNKGTTMVVFAPYETKE